MARRVVVTGGAGFLGSHLCDAFVADGDEVVVLDNLVTGSVDNVEHLFGRPGFQFVQHNVTEFIWVPGDVDVVCHLASPASPVDYLELPIQTLKVGSLGTHNALGLAKAKGARFLLASTSEVYGDPLVHPQPETYPGNVDPVGPRGVYDEAKRFAEALAMAYHRSHGIDVRIVRIHNTYGERMRPDDGRVVSTLLAQALHGDDLTVHGDGTQTRSFCYVSDMVAGLRAVLESDHVGPVNVGTTDEITIAELVDAVIEVTGSSSAVVHRDGRQDDPSRRRPDLSLLASLSDWQPVVPLRDGLTRTADWMRDQLAATGSLP